MNTDEIAILVTLVLLSGLFIGLGVPLALAKVPPNSIYGFRIRQTLDNEAVWYPVNRVTGFWCIALGILMVIMMAAVRLLGGSPVLTALVVSAVTVCGAVGMTVHGLIICRRMQRNR